MSQITKVYYPFEDAVYHAAKQNFFCMSHQWYSDTAKGCKSPFRVK